MKKAFSWILTGILVLGAVPAQAIEAMPPVEYMVGVDDVLEINILQPEQLTTTATVAPDGSIAFPYIGNVFVKDKALVMVQEEIQGRLSDGYLKYPVVMVSLKESRSRKFYVYGEVNKPGSYQAQDGLTVLGAISSAGGFTKFGSASRVKVLRPKQNGLSYITIKVDIKKVMNGDEAENLFLKAGDMVVVSEGLF